MEEFVLLTCAPPCVAEVYLGSFGGDLDRAVCAFFDDHHALGVTAAPPPPPPPPPRARSVESVSSTDSDGAVPLITATGTTPPTPGTALSVAPQRSTSQVTPIVVADSGSDDDVATWSQGAFQRPSHDAPPCCGPSGACSWIEELPPRNMPRSKAYFTAAASVVARLPCLAAYAARLPIVVCNGSCAPDSTSGASDGPTPCLWRQDTARAATAVAATLYVHCRTVRAQCSPTPHTASAIEQYCATFKQRSGTDASVSSKMQIHQTLDTMPPCECGDRCTDGVHFFNVLNCSSMIVVPEGVSCGLTQSGTAVTITCGVQVHRPWQALSALDRCRLLSALRGVACFQARTTFATSANSANSRACWSFGELTHELDIVGCLKRLAAAIHPHWAALPCINTATLFHGTLAPHQHETVAWMAHREAHPLDVVNVVDKCGNTIRYSTLWGDMMPSPADSDGAVDASGAVGIIADAPGLGKAVSALALIAATHSEGSTLVVADSAAVGRWRAQASQFLPGFEVATLTSVQQWVQLGLPVRRRLGDAPSQDPPSDRSKDSAPRPKPGTGAAMFVLLDYATVASFAEEGICLAPHRAVFDNFDTSLCIDAVEATHRWALCGDLTPRPQSINQVLSALGHDQRLALLGNAKSKCKGQYVGSAVSGPPLWASDGTVVTAQLQHFVICHSRSAETVRKFLPPLLHRAAVVELPAAQLGPYRELEDSHRGRMEGCRRRMTALVSVIEELREASAAADHPPPHPEDSLTPDSTTVLPADALETFRRDRVPVLDVVRDVVSSLLATPRTAADSDCPVCLCPLERPTVLACGHVFCRDCLVSSFRHARARHCPFCRIDRRRMRVWEIDTARCGVARCRTICRVVAAALAADASAKVVVFSPDHEELLAMVAETLSDSGTACAVLTSKGPSGADHPSAAFVDFAGAAPTVRVCLLSSNRADPFMLPLTSASHIVLTHPPLLTTVDEDPGAQLVHRMGRRAPVTVHHVIVAGTVEHRLFRAAYGPTPQDPARLPITDVAEVIAAT